MFIQNKATQQHRTIGLHWNAPQHEDYVLRIFSNHKHDNDFPLAVGNVSCRRKRSRIDNKKIIFGVTAINMLFDSWINVGVRKWNSARCHYVINVLLLGLRLGSLDTALHSLGLHHIKTFIHYAVATLLTSAAGLFNFQYGIYISTIWIKQLWPG